MQTLFIIEDLENNESIECLQNEADDDIIVTLQDVFGMDSMTADYFVEEAELLLGEKIMIKRNRRDIVGTIKAIAQS